MLHLAEFMEGIDQIGQFRRLGIDQLQIGIHLLSRHLAVPDGPGIAGYHRDRRFQIMGNIRQQLLTLAVHLLSLGFTFRQPVCHPVEVLSNLPDLPRSFQIAGSGITAGGQTFDGTVEPHQRRLNLPVDPQQEKAQHQRIHRQQQQKEPVCLCAHIVIILILLHPGHTHQDPSILQTAVKKFKPGHRIPPEKRNLAGCICFAPISEAALHDFQILIENHHHFFILFIEILGEYVLFLSIRRRKRSAHHIGIGIVILHALQLPGGKPLLQGFRRPVRRGSVRIHHRKSPAFAQVFFNGHFLVSACIEVGILPKIIVVRNPAQVVVIGLADPEYAYGQYQQCRRKQQESAGQQHHKPALFFVILQTYIPPLLR